MAKLFSFLALLLAAAALAVSLDLVPPPIGDYLTKTLSRGPATQPTAPVPVPASSDTPAEETAKVVYHTDFADPRRFSAMLTSINNMVTTYQNELQDYDVRIVFVAHGIRFVTDDPLLGTPFKEDEKLAARRDDLKNRLLSLNNVQEVKLELCEITRSQIGLDADRLYPGVDSVPSGVVRIADLQKRGFAYIKIE